MRGKSLIWISLVASSGETAGQSLAHVYPTHEQTKLIGVSTYRSDGSIFSAVTQTKRLQTRRHVRVSGSTQAMPNRAVLSPQEEAADGGLFVAAATGQSQPSAALLLYFPRGPVVIVETHFYPAPNARPKR